MYLAVVVVAAVAAVLAAFPLEGVLLAASAAAPLVVAVQEVAGKQATQPSNLTRQIGQGLSNEVLFKSLAHQVVTHEVAPFEGIFFFCFLPLFFCLIL